MKEPITQVGGAIYKAVSFGGEDLAVLLRNDEA
jgi:hypothetical protein